jgi:subtilase family serine protease
VQFELANPPKAEPGRANLRGAVVIFVLLNAEAPGATRKVEVTHFSADHQTYEFLPAKFTVQLHNSGNLHVAAHGNIFIKRGSKQVATLSVNATQALVLPSSNRIFTSDWNDGFPVYTQVTNASGQLVKDSKGNIKQKLSWNFSKVSKLRFGHYTAELVLIYNDGQRDVPITGTLSFWVIPWRLIIYTLLVLIAPAVLVYLIMRRRFNKRLEKERKKFHHASK